MPLMRTVRRHLKRFGPSTRRLCRPLVGIVVQLAVGCARASGWPTPASSRRRFRGRLLGFEAGVARLAVENDEVPIPFDEVAKARLVYEFTRADFAPAAGSR